MKWLLMMLMASSVLASETNLMTFTNNAGRIYRDVRIVKNTGDGVLYFEKDGVSGGKVKFKDLPPETSWRLGYKEGDEALAEFREKKANEQLAAQRRATLVAAAEQKRVKAVMETKMVIDGKVVQKVRDGLLVDSMSEDRRRLSEDRIMHGGHLLTVTSKEGQLYNGWCLLVGYKTYDRVVDGDIVHAVAYPDGEYSYTTVSGGTKTVRRFHMNPSMVQEIADAATLKEMKREGVQH